MLCILSFPPEAFDLKASQPTVIQNMLNSLVLTLDNLGLFSENCDLLIRTEHRCIRQALFNLAEKRKQLFLITLSLKTPGFRRA